MITVPYLVCPFHLFKSLINIFLWENLVWRYRIFRKDFLMCEHLCQLESFLWGLAMQVSQCSCVLNMQMDHRCVRICISVSVAQTLDCRPAIPRHFLPVCPLDSNLYTIKSRVVFNDNTYHLLTAFYMPGYWITGFVCVFGQCLNHL